MVIGRVYLQPLAMVYNAMLDLMELQNGKEIINDPLDGKLGYRIMMYGFVWELRFIAQNMDCNRCGVNLEIVEADNDGDCEHGYLENMILRIYALLDTMLLLGAPPEVIYSEETSVT